MEFSKFKSNKIKLGLGFVFAMSLGLTLAFAGGEKSTKADSSASNTNAITTEGMADCEKEMPDCHKKAQCPKGKKCIGHKHHAKGDSCCVKKDHDK